MKRITLDFSRFAEREGLQEYLWRAFGFPDYYGMNLDALYDELTTIAEDTELVFSEDEAGVCCEAVCEGGGPEQSEDMKRYVKKVRRVIEDAAEENGRLHI